jgi:hypothetical protein
VTPHALVLHLTRGMQDQDLFHARMHDDPPFAELVAFAHDSGIPPSIVTGRVHPNPLDPTEPLWLPEDWSDILSYRLWRRGLCARCGVHQRDWGTDADQPYVARARMCHGCAEVIDARAEFKDHKHAEAVNLTLVPYDDGLPGG